MPLKKSYFTLSDKNCIAEIQTILVDDSQAENTDNEELEALDKNEGKEDSDTDTSESIEEREEDSYSEQNDTNSSAVECGDERQKQYVALRIHKNKIIFSYYWKKIPFATRSKSIKNNLHAYFPDVKVDFFSGNGNDAIRRRVFLKRLGKQLIEEQLQKRAESCCLPIPTNMLLKEIIPEKKYSK
ncbi:hypothetical protein NPIL_80541 [Nephila pilipes]|uniref:Uncharacterized protein n=1 Tax=Nephila pilipes TaxID=299642 RepID=A0A8X6QY07_NEPPI|nr:hypothetical protein NPIL_80541 [Nephila pilipes]